MGAGKFVLENWAPLASAGQALVGRGRSGTTGTERGGPSLLSGGGMALTAMGLGLTASVAKLGLCLLQQRLQAHCCESHPTYGILLECKI